MDLEIVQWGNAQGDGTVAGTKCQHGAPECRAMRVYACNKYTASADAHASYVDCFDTTLIQTFPKGLPEGTLNVTFTNKVLQDCAQAQGFSWDTLDKCASGTEGDSYMAKEKALTPDHHAVPFVTINGGSVIYNSQSLNLIDEVCKAYTGSPKPAACTSMDLRVPPELVEALQHTPAVATAASYTSLMTPA